MSDENLDRNLRQLLRGVPAPETPRPGAEDRIFANVQERLQKAVKSDPKAIPIQAGPMPARQRHRFLRLMAVAAMLLVAMGVHIWLAPKTDPRLVREEPVVPGLTPHNNEKEPQLAALDHREPVPAEEPPALLDITTPSDKPANEKLKDGSTLEIAGGSRVRVSTWTKRARPLVELFVGAVTCRVVPASGKFTVRTPVGEASALGTEYTVRVEEQAAANPAAGLGGEQAMKRNAPMSWVMTVAVLSGMVRISGPDGESQVAMAGESVAMTKRVTPEENFQSGQLVPHLADGSKGEPLEIRRHEVNVTIRDQVSLVEVDQVFYNPSPERIEGTFYFPLPNGATISRLAMYVGDNLMEGEIAEAARARRTFEALKVLRVDPALLEWAGGNNFKMRVFPIEPKSEKRVLISYYQVLEKENDSLRFNYPLASDALQTNPVGKVSLKLSCDSQTELLAAETPGYAAKIQRESHRVTVEFSAEKARPERNFELLCKLAPDQGELAVLPFWHTASQEGYFLFVFSPRLEGFISERESGKRYVLVLDKSGGLGARHLALAAKTVIGAIGKLRQNDQFGIVAYDSVAQQFSPKLLPATPENVSAATKWVEALKPAGASDLSAAWQSAAGMAGADSAQVIYVGSGLSTLTSTRSGKLLQEAAQALGGAKVRVHCLAVGDVTDQDFLGELAKRNNGTLRPIGSAAEMSTHVAELLEDAGAPLYTGVQLSFDGVKVDEIYPQRLPNVSSGRQLMVFGKYLQQGKARVKLSAQFKDAPYEKTFEVNLGSQSANSCVPPLWATRKIEHLQREVSFADAETSSRLTRTLVETSKRYTVMSQYTSFLVLECPEDYLRYGIERRVREFGPYAGQGGESPAEQLQQLSQGFQGKAKPGWGAGRGNGESRAGDPQGGEKSATHSGKYRSEESYGENRKAENSLRKELKDVADDGRFSINAPSADGKADRLAKSLEMEHKRPGEALRERAAAESPPAPPGARALQEADENNKSNARGEALRRSTSEFQTDALSWGRADIFPVIENPPGDPTAGWPAQWQHSDAKALEILTNLRKRLENLSCKVSGYRVDKNGKEIQEGRVWEVAFDTVNGKYLSYRVGEESKDVCDGARLARYFPLLKYAASRKVTAHDFRQLSASLPGWIAPWTENLERYYLISIEKQNAEGLILRLINRGDDKAYIRLFLESDRGPVTQVEVYRRHTVGNRIYSVLAQTVQCLEFKDFGGVRIPTAIKSFQVQLGVIPPDEVERLKKEIEKLTAEEQLEKARELRERLETGNQVISGPSLQRLADLQVNAQLPKETFEIAVPKDWSVRNVDAQPKIEDRTPISTPINPSLNEWGRNPNMGGRRW